MSKFRKIIDKSVIDNDTNTMHKITTVIDDHLTALEYDHPKMYWKIIFDLYEVVYGSHFNEEMAMYAVKYMKNEDGTEGAHWTMAETSSVASSEGIVFDSKVNAYDWFYTLNMMYSDYYNVIGSDTAMYIRFAKSFLMDMDAPDGKAWKYYRAMSC